MGPAREEVAFELDIGGGGVEVVAVVVVVVLVEMRFCANVATLRASLIRFSIPLEGCAGAVVGGEYVWSAVAEGAAEGAFDGATLGAAEGALLTVLCARFEGATDGAFVGAAEGALLTVVLATVDGATDGAFMGAAEGATDGAFALLAALGAILAGLLIATDFAFDAELTTEPALLSCPVPLEGRYTASILFPSKSSTLAL